MSEPASIVPGMLWRAPGIVVLGTVLTGLVSMAGSSVSAAEPDPADPESTRAMRFDASKLEGSGIDAASQQRLAARFTRTREALLQSEEQLSGQDPMVSGRGYVAMRDRLVADLQAQLGPREYDWFLYAAGWPNRVVVRAVAIDGPVDLQTGDMILRYGEQRVFTVHDLRRALPAPEAAEPVHVEVRRSGRRAGVQVPAGALSQLGVQLEGVLERPAPLPADASP